MAEVMTREQIRECRFDYRGFALVEKICDSYEALRAERDRLAAQLAEARQELAEIRYAGGLLDSDDLALSMRALRKDERRLDFLIDNMLRPVAGNVWNVEDESNDTGGKVLGSGRDGREAIDAAMERE